MSFYRVEPLPEWPFERHSPRLPPFKASYTDTLEVLARELRMLRAVKGSVVLRVVTDGANIRKDGMLRSGARVFYHGVALTFDCRHGTLVYPCDTYSNGRMPGWQANLRAIAVSLEALRLADRHGVAGNGQQYRGWLAIGPSTTEESLPFRDANEAWTWVCRLADAQADGDIPLRRPAVIRLARREVHPDANGGDQTRWDQLEKAVELMAATGMTS